MYMQDHTHVEHWVSKSSEYFRKHRHYVHLHTKLHLNPLARTGRRPAEKQLVKAIKVSIRRCRLCFVRTLKHAKKRQYNTTILVHWFSTAT